MIDLAGMQKDAGRWFAINLARDPQSDKFCQALGLSEEAGEVAHIVRVDFQGIREGVDKNMVQDEILDGVGDVVFYAMNLCSLYGISIEQAITKVAEKVLKRDWVKHPADAHLEVEKE